MGDTLNHIKVHYETVGNKSAVSASEEVEESWDFPPFIINLFGEKGWADTYNLTSAARARTLALKLEERGYHCDFTETDLVITLPLRLHAEENSAGPEFEDGLEEEGAAGATA